ncbi:pilus (MSHA type) biogenesis protein MshL [Betaproteobacteria bacterium]|nr:pilus (MSHA type) biogenesis protein MshL [Betaproteobacteria bacterium]
MKTVLADAIYPGRSKPFAIVAMAALLLGGCASYRSFDTFNARETIPDTGMVENIAKESEKLARNYDELFASLNRSEAPEPLMPVEPVFDLMESRTVSINMRDVDIGQLLWTLEDQAGMNLVIDPLVLKQGMRASLHLKNVTVREVYNHILEAFDLHGEVRNNALVINLLEERLFNAGFLNTNIGINLSSGGDVFGGNSSSGGSSGGGGNSDTLRADFSITGGSAKEIDSYEQLENAIKQILGLSGGRDEGPKRSPSISTPGAGEPPPVPVAFSLNRATGSLYVKARPRQIRAVAQLIERNTKMLRRQIQVEAQLIDVQLNDDYRFGVDWTLLRRNLAGIYGPDAIGLSGQTGPFPSAVSAGSTNLLDRVITIPGQAIGGSAAGNPGLGLGYGGKHFSATLRALSSFGTLRVLSNPSVRVRNGSPALLSVGTNIRYISKSSNSQNNSGGGSSLSSSDVETDSLFSGVVVGVVPFIHDNGRIELLVHPMQTDVAPESLALITLASGNVVTLPRISYKGLTTTLNLANGDMVLIGGLIDQSKSYGKDGIPGLSDIPNLGNLFGGQDSLHNSRELVVVLRVRLP